MKCCQYAPRTSNVGWFGRQEETIRETISSLLVFVVTQQIYDTHRPNDITSTRVWHFRGCHFAPPTPFLWLCNFNFAWPNFGTNCKSQKMSAETQTVSSFKKQFFSLSLWSNFEMNNFVPFMPFMLANIQGILKGEVSLYHWPPVWLVWNQLYD